MHGLINRAFQCFLTDTFGAPVWAAVAREAGCPADGFEAMLTYDAAETEALVAAAVAVLRRPREALLEDFGHYFVSHPNREALRRLLRFGGVGFADFLLGIEDLPGRARLALPDLDLPQFDLRDEAENQFLLSCTAPLPGTGHVILGLLRAMADDYGALVLLDHMGGGDGREEISVQLLDISHAEGRRFDLAPAMAGVPG